MFTGISVNADITFREFDYNGHVRIAHGPVGARTRVSERSVNVPLLADFT